MVAETWSWEEDKAFENALAVHYADTCSNWWEKISAVVPGKTLKAIKNHYAVLVEDIRNIESGRVPLPNYSSPSSSSSTAEGSGDGGGNGKQYGSSHGDSIHELKGSRLDYERRKGIAWTEEEHRLFLLGLDKYGKGDWRSISRNFVVSRTPTQVASHAQKYFIRLNSTNTDRRRSSIHDIININNIDISASQGPITGQGSNSGTAPGTSKSSNLPSLTNPAGHENVIYGGPLMPVIGTSLTGLPMAYGIQPPSVARVVVSRAPACLVTPTTAYPLYNSLP